MAEHKCCYCSGAATTKLKYTNGDIIYVCTDDIPLYADGIADVSSI